MLRANLVGVAVVLGVARVAEARHVRFNDDAAIGGIFGSEANVCGVDAARLVIDKGEGLYSFSCNPGQQAAGNCHPTWTRQYKFPSFPMRGSEPDEPAGLKRVGLDMAVFEDLLGKQTIGPNVNKILRGEE